MPLKLLRLLPMRKFIIITTEGTTQDRHGVDCENAQVVWMGDALDPDDALRQCGEMWGIGTVSADPEDEIPFNEVSVYEIPLPPIYKTLENYR